MTATHPLCPARPAEGGMTLIETMVCILVLAVLTSLAGPAFRDMLQRQRIAAVRTELTAALHAARWEALRRNSPLTLQRRSDCPELLRTPNDWHCGWQLVVAAPGEPQVLQSFDLPPGVRLVHASGATLPIARNGMPALVAHRFVISPSGEGAPSTTALCVNRTGRVRAVLGQATC
jgi:type IV fimbrial biogenesis protein FimT